MSLALRERPVVFGLLAETFRLKPELAGFLWEASGASGEDADFMREKARELGPAVKEARIWLRHGQLMLDEKPTPIFVSLDQQKPTVYFKSATWSIDKSLSAEANFRALEKFLNGKGGAKYSALRLLFLPGAFADVRHLDSPPIHPGKQFQSVTANVLAFFLIAALGLMVSDDSEKALDLAEGISALLLKHDFERLSREEIQKYLCSPKGQSELLKERISCVKRYDPQQIEIYFVDQSNKISLRIDFKTAVISTQPADREVAQVDPSVLKKFWNGCESTPTMALLQNLAENSKGSLGELLQKACAGQKPTAPKTQARPAQQSR